MSIGRASGAAVFAAAEGAANAGAAPASARTSRRAVPICERECMDASVSWAARQCAAQPSQRNAGARRLGAPARRFIVRALSGVSGSPGSGLPLSHPRKANDSMGDLTPLVLDLEKLGDD